MEFVQSHLKRVQCSRIRFQDNGICRTGTRGTVVNWMLFSLTEHNIQLFNSTGAIMTVYAGNQIIPSVIWHSERSVEIETNQNERACRMYLFCTQHSSMAHRICHRANRQGTLCGIRSRHQPVHIVHISGNTSRTGRFVQQHTGNHSSGIHSNMTSLQRARVSLGPSSQSRSEIRHGSSLRNAHRELFACSLREIISINFFFFWGGGVEFLPLWLFSPLSFLLLFTKLKRRPGPLPQIFH